MSNMKTKNTNERIEATSIYKQWACVHEFRYFDGDAFEPCPKQFMDMMLRGRRRKWKLEARLCSGMTITQWKHRFDALLAILPF